jgi:hypothetical protein
MAASPRRFALTRADLERKCIEAEDHRNRVIVEQRDQLIASYIRTAEDLAIAAAEKGDYMCELEVAENDIIDSVVALIDNPSEGVRALAVGNPKGAFNYLLIQWASGADLAASDPVQ